MLPDDANPNSNVHGGTILKLIDQAGNIVATRHCNRSGDQDNKLITVLARVEHTDFHQPMRIAEVSQVQAAVTFTSKRSMEVMVDVWAENLVSGERRHTNSATLWYVATLADAKGDYPPELKPMPIPPMTDLALQEKGMQRYENQKRARMAELNREFHHSGKEHEHYTVGSSRTTLANLVLPSDCYRAGYMMGGPLMKMMDSAAAICAAKHCHTQAVTASLEAINFISPVMNGEVVFVTAELIFTSTKSMEIELLVEAEGGLKGGSRRVTNTAHFTFVSLGKDGHAIAVPPLKVVPEKKERFEEGRKRYENRKRLQKKKLKQL